MYCNGPMVEFVGKASAVVGQPNVNVGGQECTATVEEGRPPASSQLLLVNRLTQTEASDIKQTALSQPVCP